MERFENIEKELKKRKISCFLPSQNVIKVGNEFVASLLFHKYTHADKAIEVLKELGFNLKTSRERNPFNAYFKYYIAIS